MFSFFKNNNKDKPYVEKEKYAIVRYSEYITNPSQNVAPTWGNDNDKFHNNLKQILISIENKGIYPEDLMGLLTSESKWITSIMTLSYFGEQAGMSVEEQIKFVSHYIFEIIKDGNLLPIHPTTY